MTSFPGRDHRYDVAIVGAGIAGSEAAFQAARSGLDVLLVTTSLDTVYMLAHGRYRLSPPEGTLLEGLWRQGANSAGELERWELHRAAKYALEAQAGIHLLQSNVTGLLLDEGRVSGVLTWEGVPRHASTTALCVGSFLGARLEQGSLREVAGRLGEMSYDELLRDLESHGVEFDERELLFDDASEGLPYRVGCRVLAASELSEGAVSRLPGLFAAGVCAGGGARYELAAEEGLELGRRLVAAAAGQP